MSDDDKKIDIHEQIQNSINLFLFRLCLVQVEKLVADSYKVKYTGSRVLRRVGGASLAPDDLEYSIELFQTAVSFTHTYVHTHTHCFKKAVSL